MAICLGLLFACPLGAQQDGTPFGQSAENPGISAVGEVLGAYDFDSNEWYGGLGNAELAFRAPIDPFGRMDLLLHYNSGLLEGHHDHGENEEGDEHDHGSGFAVEEALVTLTSLPWKIQASAGRMRSRIGLLNVIHLHDFNFIQYPRVITDYWGEEGLSVDGLRLSWLAPLPFWSELVLEGQRQLEAGSNFGTFGANFFVPFGEDLGLSLSGFGFIDKPELEHEEHEEHDSSNYAVNGWGSGFRLKWKPTEQALYKHIIVQGELMNRTLHDEDYLGLYFLSEYKLSRRWTVGALFESVETPHAHEHHEDPESSSQLGVAVSYWPSEFQRIRLQYDHPFDEDDEGNTLMLQWTFIVGPHKPHAY